MVVVEQGMVVAVWVQVGEDGEMVGVEREMVLVE